MLRSTGRPVVTIITYLMLFLLSLEHIETLTYLHLKVAASVNYYAILHIYHCARRLSIKDFKYITNFLFQHFAATEIIETKN